MKISLLIDREPFDSIFEKTLTSFLNDFTNDSHRVKWYPKSHNKQNTESVQIWYCNPLINSIFVKDANPNIFDSISGEYSTNPLKPWRSLIQKLYLNLSVNKIIAPLMAKYFIEVSPPIKDAKNKLIIGGNTKIRIIDVINKRVFVILKIGFDKKYLEREIYVREKFKNLPIPKINLYGKNGLWYCEDYVSGKSPDRMEVNKGHNVLFEAVQQVHKILNETKKNVSLTGYVEDLLNRIINNADKISIINEATNRKIKEIASTLAAFLNRNADQDITTAYCHGDFQEGNIIYDGEKTWILDWEYSGSKQIGYDLFVLLLKSRVSKGFTKRFIRFINNELAANQMELINSWPEIEWRKKSDIKKYLLLFLLEEIDFHLEENSNKLFFNSTNGLNTIINQVDYILTQNTLINEK